jgi:hypothetical protein
MSVSRDYWFSVAHIADGCVCVFRPCGRDRTVPVSLESGVSIKDANVGFSTGLP